MKQPLGLFERWKHRAIGGVLLIAGAPFLLALVIQMLNGVALTVTDVVMPLVPYVVVSIALYTLYRIIIGRRM